MPLLDLFWTILLLFLLFAWFWLLITIFIDIFRNHAMNGWVKALWVVFIIILPLLGVLIYLIVHGGDMQRRKLDEAAQMQQAQNEYIRQVAGSSGDSAADQLEKLKNLHDRGALTDEEYQQQKQKVLNAS